MSKREGARPETYRVFIAISLPEQVKDEIERAQEELRGALPAECVRWTKRGQFHLTLKFLGDVESRRLEALTDSVGRACEGFGILQLRAGRIGFESYRVCRRAYSLRGWVLWHDRVGIPLRYESGPFGWSASNRRRAIAATTGPIRSRSASARSATLAEFVALLRVDVTLLACLPVTTTATSSSATF